MTIHPLTIAGWTEAMLAVVPTPQQDARTKNILARIDRRAEISFYLKHGYLAWEEASFERNARVALRIMDMRERAEIREASDRPDYVMTERDLRIDDIEEDERQSEMFAPEPSLNPDEVD